MTDEQILNKLNELIGAALTKKDITTADFWGKMHDAFKKQVPRDAYHNRTGVRVCPECHGAVAESHIYCWHCGQMMW